MAANHRAIVTVGNDIGWCLGLILTPAVTYFVRDWVLIQRIIVLPEFIFVILFWWVAHLGITQSTRAAEPQTFIPRILTLYVNGSSFLDESPKWLLSVGRQDEARRLLQKIIRMNKLEGVDVDAIVQDATIAVMKVAAISASM